MQEKYKEKSWLVSNNRLDVHELLDVSTKRIHMQTLVVILETSLRKILTNSIVTN